MLVDGEVPSKSLRLPMGVLLEVDLPTPDTTPPPTASLDILYEDEDLIVINKPVGVAAHTGPGWDGPTVISSLEAAGVRVSTSGPTERQGIVQRLDVRNDGCQVRTGLREIEERLPEARGAQNIPRCSRRPPGPVQGNN